MLLTDMAGNTYLHSKKGKLSDTSNPILNQTLTARTLILAAKTAAMVGQPEPEVGGLMTPSCHTHTPLCHCITPLQPNIHEQEGGPQ